MGTMHENVLRQAAGLKQLRKSLGLTTTVIAGRLGFQTSQAYELYERAKSRLKVEQLPVWADAFGVSRNELVDALGLTDTGPTPEETAELRATLEAAELPEDRIRELLTETRRLSQQPVRLAAIRAAISLWREVHPE